MDKNITFSFPVEGILQCVVNLNLIEGCSKTAKKVTIDEGQNTVQSNGGSIANNGFLKPTSLDLDLEKNVLSGRFSVSPVNPGTTVDTEGIHAN